MNQYTGRGAAAQLIELAGRASADATVTVKATRGGSSTYYTPERAGEGFGVNIPVPASGVPVTTELEVNAVRFDAGRDVDLVKTVAGTYTTALAPLTYDADGNLTSWDGWNFTWNGENRLIRAVNGSAKVEFDYDYMGRRIFKKVMVPGNGASLCNTF